MSLTLEMIDIVPSDSCNNDYLEVREKDGSGKVLGKKRDLTFAIFMDS